ncbi:MAG TPA: tRNA (N(6)-L-threonylcarbamoyladenosine(37)-C(2))-methylthiotransferase MtaB, partial [Chloroflexi bacterium]|nr:tRNA (N(6)-L-threonylcarbamoyladenosine(37)-C(2))-methylthiotransferase MtaB [Chloroflexota bacterium]
MRVYLTFLGCRVNESEIESLGRDFLRAGHRLVTDPAQADLVVVNTCTVTGEAGRKSRRLIRRLHRINPRADLAVTGCHVEAAWEEVAVLPGVRWLVGNADKERLVEIVAPPAAPMDREPLLRDWRPGRWGHTRAFVKVQDGCDNRCTFCVTTLVRGTGRSRPLADVVREVQALVEAGYREVVLTGIHLGSYGHDWGDRQGLRHLVEALLTDTDLLRLRLSSLEPWDLDEAFFRLWESPRLCPHLHLPLQSGCDATLRRMARRTTTARYRRLVEAARSAIPDLALTTDVIVGFPGETEEAFRRSYDFVAEIGFAKLHVFPYSPRPGTAAARMADQVPQAVKVARGRAMRHLGERMARAFRERFLGRTLPVLWEGAV